MIYNHERKAVWEWTNGGSYCPECGSVLVARKGELVCWHWAHKASTDRRRNCPHAETAWHLAMKAAYLSFNGWEVEVPIACNGNKYRVDAMNPTTGRIREFVHSLSPFYFSKHLNMKKAGFDAAWIIDGKMFVSKRVKECRGDGLRGLLKPRAFELHAAVNTMVHHAGALWHEWRNNVWFKRDGEAAHEIMARMSHSGS